MDDAIDTAFPANPASLRLAREAVADFDDVDEETAAALKVIVTELLSNAIQHGGSETDVRLSVERRGDLVRVVVTDRGRGFTAQYGKHDRVGGGGLALIQAVASRFGVTRACGETEAWAEIDLA